MSHIYTRCRECGRVWFVARLPMQATKVIRLMSRAACSNGCESDPVLASEDEFNRFTRQSSEPPA